jgi:crossover junction endodeoxyribonuclease RuvC
VAVVRILGVDPGTVVVGYGCLEMEVDPPPGDRSRMPLALRADNTMSSPGLSAVRVLDAGAIRLGSDRAPLERRLLALSELLAKLLSELCPGELALEEAFFGKSVQSALRIGEARGVVLAESARRGLPVHQFAPARIKRCITGQGNAQKETVAAMVCQLLAGTRELGDLPADATDALAVALCRAEQRRSPLLQANARGNARRRFRAVQGGA